MELFSFQKKVIEENKLTSGLFFGTGCGKSLTAIKLAEKNSRTALICCPKSLVDNWILNEIPKWSEGNVVYSVMSKENFKKLHKTLQPVDHFFIDEAQHFSGVTSQMYKSAISYIKDGNIKRVNVLTASPYRSTMWNIYALAKILGREWNYIKFRSTYFYPIKMGNRIIWQQKDKFNGLPMEIEVARLCNAIGYTATLDDIKEVPEQTYRMETFETTSEQKKAIKENFDPMPIIRVNKEQQITSGILIGDAYNTPKYFKTEKTNRLIEIIEDNNKIAIVCRFTLEIENIYTILKNKFPKRNIYTLHGKTETSERNKIINKIHAEDNSIVIINAKLCEGYSLETIPIMVFHSMDYGLTEFQQIIGRLQRANNIKHNTYVFMVTKGQVDYAVYDCVVNKKMKFVEEIFCKG